MSSFKLDWNGKELIAEVEGICEDAVFGGAKKIAKDARRFVPKDTRGLEKSIHVKKFKKTGVIGAYVKAGEKDKEHIAGFVELGTPGETYRIKSKKGQTRTPIKASPYMRPALKKNKRKIRNAFSNKLK